MVEIVRLIEHRKRIRDDLTAEILNHDRHPAADDIETDRLIRTLNTLMTETPMAARRRSSRSGQRLLNCLPQSGTRKSAIFIRGKSPRFSTKTSSKQPGRRSPNFRTAA